jgi:uncharacterized protein (DUF58 family)
MRIFLIFLTVILVYWLQKRVYTKNCFENLTADINFNTHGIFCGEKAKLEVVFLNRKLLPLWWMSLKFYLSRNIIFDDEIKENEGNDNFRKDVFYLGSYERLTKNYNMTAGSRGYYKIREMELASGDVFGSVRIIKNIACSTELYVYPALLDPLELNIAFSKMNGEILTQRHIIEDHFQLKGIRQYEPFDSMKMVNWSATAKTGELKVNQYDYTSSGEITIMINFERHNSWDPDEIFEKSISLAASLSTEYLRYGMSVELITNGCDTETGKAVSIGIGNNMNHNLTIYENLARIDIHTVSSPLHEIISEEINAKRRRRVIVIISQYFDEYLEESIRSAKYRGFDIKRIIPKDTKTKITIEDLDDLYVWEVKNL